MNVTPQRRVHTAAPTDGSRTITLRDAQPRSEDDEPAAGGSAARSSSSAAVGVLKLRGAQRRTRQRVAWGADVVDNEGCGKKKSKICCIYHKPRRFDESSSESESDSSDSDGRDRARPTRRCRHHHGAHRHGHEDGSGSASGIARRDAQGGSTVHEIDDSDVNAYERNPKWKT